MVTGRFTVSNFFIFFISPCAYFYWFKNGGMVAKNTLMAHGVMSCIHQKSEPLISSCQKSMFKDNDVQEKKSWAMETSDQSGHVSL